MEILKVRNVKYLSVFLAILIFVLAPINSFAISQAPILEAEYTNVIDGVKYKFKEKMTSDYVVHTQIFKEINSKFILEDVTEYYIDDEGTAYKYSEKTQETKIMKNKISKLSKSEIEKLENLYNKQSTTENPLEIKPLYNSDWVDIGSEYKHRVWIENETKLQIAAIIVRVLVSSVVRPSDLSVVAGAIYRAVRYGPAYVGEQSQRDANYSDGYKKFRIGVVAYSSSTYNIPISDRVWTIYLR
jgi:hypothetical protein